MMISLFLLLNTIFTDCTSGNDSRLLCNTQRRTRAFAAVNVVLLNGTILDLTNFGFEKTCVSNELDRIVYTAPAGSILGTTLPVGAVVQLSFLPTGTNCTGLLQICTSGNITLGLTGSVAQPGIVSPLIITITVGSTSPYVISISLINCLTISSTSSTATGGIVTVTTNVCSPFLPASNTVTYTLTATLLGIVNFTNVCPGLNLTSDVKIQ